MIANLLISRCLNPSELVSVLSDVVGVPTSQVDVCHVEGDQEGRDWDAAVLCTYHYVRGDIVMSLDIYVRDDIDNPNEEPEVAAAFARRAETGTLYSDDRVDPETFWLADPDSTVTPARLVASEGVGKEDEMPTYTVQAVEAPSSAFPNAEVTPLAELLRDVPIPTPIAAAIDLDSPAVVVLTIWERLIRRMAGDWAPSGRYLPELYAEDLTMRDHLEREIAASPDTERATLRDATAKIDAMFRDLTEENPVKVTNRAGWWHTRLPRLLPWPRK